MINNISIIALTVDIGRIYNSIFIAYVIKNIFEKNVCMYCIGKYYSKTLRLVVDIY